MKYLVTFILITIGVFSAQSQTYEIGGILGGTNYIGDVGRTSIIAPNDVFFGAILKWNRSARHSFRFTAIHASISGDDADAKGNRRKERGLEFKNTFNELSLGIEYTFWEFDMYEGKPASAPYLYTGITYFWYEALFKDLTDNVIKDFDSDASIAIPMVIGFKTTVGTKMIFAFEIGARYTFTDDLDGSNPVKGLEDNERIKFGDINDNDWYVFSGITLTFTFGRQPCYCNF